MTTDTDPRTEKLPKWARDRMERLERSAAYWEEKYHEGPEDSNTFIETFVGAGRPLGSDTQIRFQFSDGAKIVVGIKRGRLQAYGIGSRGSDQFAVFPESSNVISLEMNRR